MDVLLPAGSQSWSYRLTAGADVGAANFAQVLPVSQLPAGVGSLQLGVPVPANCHGCMLTNPTSGTQQDSSSYWDGAAAGLLTTYYQVIRTGTGNIDIAAGRDVQLLNPFASIYTAGTQVTPVPVSTLNSGGSVNLLANVPIVFPNMPAGDTIQVSKAAIVTDSMVLTAFDDVSNFQYDPWTVSGFPPGTVFTLPYGFALPNHVSPTNVSGLMSTAMQTVLVAPASSEITLASAGRANLRFHGAGYYRSERFRHVYRQRQCVGLLQRRSTVDAERQLYLHL